MAFSAHQADRIRQRLLHLDDVEEKKMMGGLIFMVHGKMCIGLDQVKASGKDRLMVRVGPHIYKKLLLKKGSRPMDFTGRIMKGYLFIDPEGFDSESDLDFWIELALRFNKTLPGN